MFQRHNREYSGDVYVMFSAFVYRRLGGIQLTTVSVQNHEPCPDLSRQFIPNSAKLRVKLELKENLPLP